MSPSTALGNALTCIARRAVTVKAAVSKPQIVNSRIPQFARGGRPVVARSETVGQRWMARPFSTAPVMRHGDLRTPAAGEERRITFVTPEGESQTFIVADGDNLLDIAQAHDIDMEGACGGSCACSTCHVIVEDQDMYDRIPEPDDDENDMLDLAFGLTETSRLGCQVKMAKELDGIVVKLPSMTRNLQSSDFSRR